MNPTTKATIEFVIEKYKLRRDHDTAGNLIDALKKDGKGTAVQNLTEAMATKDYLSRSTLINNFLRDIDGIITEGWPNEPADIQGDLREISKVHEEEMKNRVTVNPKEILIPEKPSSIKYRCNHWTGSSMCSNRASILLVTDTEPLIAFGLCTDHQYGDLTKIPIAQARGLPWEKEAEPEASAENKALANEVKSWAGKEIIVSHAPQADEICGSGLLSI